jgi:hypothetical protein
MSALFETSNATGMRCLTNLMMVPMKNHILVLLRGHLQEPLIEVVNLLPSILINCSCYNHLKNIESLSVLRKMTLGNSEELK